MGSYIPPNLPIGGGQKPPPENQPPPEGGNPGNNNPPPGQGQQPPPSKPAPPGGQPPPDNKPPPSGGGPGPGSGSGSGGGSSGGGGSQPPPNGGQPGPAPPPPDSSGSGGTGGQGSSGCLPCQPSEAPLGDPQPAGPDHPLNQLDQDEITNAASIIKLYARQMDVNDLIFASISMKEPPKALLLPYLQGQTTVKPPRKAWSVFSPNGINEAYEAVVNLDTMRVEEFTKLPAGTQPSFNTDDPLEFQDIARNDARVWERAQRAGVTNKEYLICDLWSYGYNDTPIDRTNRRLLDMYLYARKFEGDNQYAHPLDFLITIDAVEKRVIDIVDLPVCPVRGNEIQDKPQNRPVPPPERSANYDPRVLTNEYFRNDIKPLNITQPKGPSFTITGNRINWQRWEMIVGFNFREGLTLHNISFNDNGKKRSILYRAAISEMVVPYGDPRPPFYRKSAFDLGEYGLGFNANPLTNGCDCLGEIRYMDFVYADSKGEPQVTASAICIHEEDYGILQKHTEFRNGNVTIARSRRLVIQFIATVTNYDYLFNWRFYQDGTIHVDVTATGILSTHPLGLGDCGTGGYGTMMAPRVNAPYHQHMFCARLDTMVDGPNNTVAIQELVPLDDPLDPEGNGNNPFGQGFKTTLTPLETAGESGTDTEPDYTRTWIVMNENSFNPNTKLPVGWKLVAPGFSRILASPESGIYKRAGFARHNVWVTPFNDEQLYAAGKYINQAPGDRDGVAVWTEQNGSIKNTDIVLWHTFGLNHVTRTEDYPLMPVEGTFFIFRPCNFFAQSPALDVGSPKKSTCT